MAGSETRDMGRAKVGGTLCRPTICNGRHISNLGFKETFWMLWALKNGF